MLNKYTLSAFFFGVFSVLTYTAAAQLAVSADSIDFGSFTADSIPQKSIPFRVSNYSGKAVEFYPLKIQDFVYNSLEFELNYSEDYGKQLTGSRALVKLDAGATYNFSVSINTDYLSRNPTEQVRHTIIAHTPSGELVVDIPVKLHMRRKVVCNKPDIELGKVNQGDTVTGSFSLKNTSNKAVTFSNCLKPESVYLETPVPLTIQPYEESVLKFKVVTATLSDSVSDYLQLYTESNNDPPFYLHYNLFVDSVKSYACMKFEQTRIYREIEFGGDGDYAFPFTNIGTAPLIISACRSSCGCLVPHCSMQPVMPGKTDVIKAHYDTRRVGPFTKTLTISSNDRYEPNKILYVTGVVSAEK